MNQKTIREHNGTAFSVPEAVEWLKELDDRTKSNEDGYNSINELVPKVQKNEGVEHNNTSVLTPIDAQNSFSSTDSGAIKISLPNSYNNCMISLEIVVFNYVDGGSFKVFISGYNHTNGSNIKWLRTTAMILGTDISVDHTVRFGNDGSKSCIYIGELNTVWNHLKCYVNRGYFGFSNYEKEKWLDGWDISLETSEFENVIITHTNNLPVSQ